MMDEDYPYIWTVKRRLADRWGQRCRVLKRLARPDGGDSVQLEFEDGFRVVASGDFIRRKLA